MTERVAAIPTPWIAKALAAVAILCALVALGLHARDAMAGQRVSWQSWAISGSIIVNSAITMAPALRRAPKLLLALSLASLALAIVVFVTLVSA